MFVLVIYKKTGGHSMKKILILLSVIVFGCSSPNEPEFSEVNIEFISYKPNLSNTGTIIITVSGSTSTGYIITTWTESGSQGKSVFILPDAGKTSSVKIRFIKNISSTSDTVYIEARNDLLPPRLFVLEYTYQ